MGRPKTTLTPTKEELYHEYVDLGLSTKALTRKYGDVYTYLHRYAIPCRGYPLTTAQQTPFSQQQLEIVYGKLMGDGSLAIPTRCRWPSLSIEHGANQEGYVLWLHSQLQPFPGKLEHYAPRTTVCQGRVIINAGSVRFRTCVHSDLFTPFKLFMCDDGKVPTLKALQQLTPRSLAVWFMDDGSGTFDKGFYFCTGLWPESVQHSIQDWFRKTYGLNSHLRFLREGGYRVTFYGSDARRLMDIMAPYWAPSMLYKVK